MLEVIKISGLFANVLLKYAQGISLEKITQKKK